MKKILAIICTLIISMFCLTGCNKQIIDITYSFNYAVIYNFDGSIIKEGEIKSWKDFEDGEQLQIVFKDGSTYLTNSFRCDLIKE